MEDAQGRGCEAPPSPRSWEISRANRCAHLRVVFAGEPLLGGIFLELAVRACHGGVDTPPDDSQLVDSGHLPWGHPWGDQSRMSEVSERDREEVPFRTRLFAAFSDARLRS